MKTIPGTNIPLCMCCEDEPAAMHDGQPVRDALLGPVCADCIPHLAAAVVAVVAIGSHFGLPKSKPAKSK